MPHIYQSGIVSSNDFYTNMALYDNCQFGKPKRMRNNLEYMRKRAGLTREELADRMHTTATTIYRKERGDRQLRTEELSEYAKALDCRPEDLVASNNKKGVPIWGMVGAGAKIYPIDDHAQGAAIEEIDPPVGHSPDNIGAVIVRGDSMEPMIEDGWIIFYTKRTDGVSPECVGELCVVKLNDDSMMVKKVRQGSKPGLFHLLSKNPNHEPIFDAKLQWAARVIDIRPR